MHTLIRMAFDDANNYMKNGTLMRQVINKINDIDFNASDDRHMFGDIYEKLLKDLQSAGNKRRLPIELVYYEACRSQADATKREKYLKTAWGKRYLKNRHNYLTG